MLNIGAEEMGFPQGTIHFVGSLLIPFLRAAWNDFQAANFLEIIDNPDYTLQQTQHILNNTN